MHEEAKIAVQKGDVVQFNPGASIKGLGGCFVVVTEAKNWGVVGYMTVPREGALKSEKVKVSAQFKEIEFVGKAHFVSRV